MIQFLDANALMHLQGSFSVSAQEGSLTWPKMLKTSQYIFGPFCSENDGRPKFLLKLVKPRRQECAVLIWALRLDIDMDKVSTSPTSNTYSAQPQVHLGLPSSAYPIPKNN